MNIKRQCFLFLQNNQIYIYQNNVNDFVPIFQSK